MITQPLYNVDSQPIGEPTIDGEYFQPNTDNAIFILNQRTLNATMNVQFKITTGILTANNPIIGNPPESVTIQVSI